MKLLLPFFLIFLVTLAQEDPLNFETVHAKCQSDPETGIYGSAVDDFENDHSKTTLPENFNKHVQCMANGVNIIKDNGKVNVEGIREQAKKVIHDTEEVEKVVKECAVDFATNHETLHQVWQCLHKKGVLQSKNKHE
ncbi:hypothetical protein ABEB36_003276 [Hypothenemus hampei]|uniref:Uncharacterized protein n=1 Tax=Hypothenemus hampei TaxID=57062 RepID=A0ABD1F8M3_HYPHA